MTLIFEDDVQPVRGEDNPYTDVIMSIRGTDKVKRVFIESLTVDSKAVRKAKRLLTEAGHAAGVTTRVHVDNPAPRTTGEGDAATTVTAVKIRFWTTKRIMRKTPEERKAEAMKRAADKAAAEAAKKNDDAAKKQVVKVTSAKPGK